MGEESPPFKVPEQRVRTLQKAFINTLKDPQRLAEAEKAKLEIDPVDGPGIEKMGVKVGLRELLLNSSKRRNGELYGVLEHGPAIELIIVAFKSLGGIAARLRWRACHGARRGGGRNSGRAARRRR